MREIPFIFPSLEQQKKIYEFLSKKIKQIDQAISLKQQQIEKLNEYKQIVIQNAVTKGLNPNAPMKNSGVDWIGDIPEHWDVIRFRNAFRFNKGLNITKENLNDEQGILCLNYGEIHSKYGFEFIPNVHPLKFVDESYLKNNQKSLLNNGDFVFADTSEDIEGSGNFSYINGQDLVFAGYHTLIAKPKINFNSRFIAYVLDSSAFRNQVRVRVKGVKVFSITQAILKTTFIWLPTEQEQNEIVKYLDEKMQKFNNAKIAYQIQIDRLKEYKNILINQAVTGKIKI
jgi:type I restriction enzyme S subunit